MSSFILFLPNFLIMNSAGLNIFVSSKISMCSGPSRCSSGVHNLFARTVCNSVPALIFFYLNPVCVLQTIILAVFNHINNLTNLYFFSDVSSYSSNALQMSHKTHLCGLQSFGLLFFNIKFHTSTCLFWMYH
jgi:hypothetical protein